MEKLGILFLLHKNVRRISPAFHGIGVPRLTSAPALRFRIFHIPPPLWYTSPMTALSATT